MISEEKKAYNKKYYEENKEFLRNQNKVWRKEHKEELAKKGKNKYEENKEQILAQSKEYRSREKSKEMIRKRRLSKLGWTPDMYANKLKEQKGLCAICKIPTAPLCTGGILGADHEHTVPPKPRGLLCSRCNTGLGQFLDNPILLLEAIIYLAKYALEAQNNEQSL